MNALEKLRYRLFGVDPESVAAYQTVLPKHIYVAVRRDGEHYIAKIKKVDDKSLDKSLLITEATDLDSLVGNVNDLLYTYVDMPLYIRPYYGNVFKPEGYDLKEQSKKLSNLVLTKA